MTIKSALASDIDGTLSFKHIEGSFKKEDLDAIICYQNNGHLFGLCSGRPMAGVLDALPTCIQCDFFIASSGAVIFNKEKEIIFEKMISYEVAKNIYDEYKDKTLIIFQTNSRNKIYKSEHEDFDNIDCVAIDDISIIKDMKIYGISLVVETDEQAMEYNEIIQKKYSHIEGFCNKNSIDFVSRGCSKGIALKFIKKYYDVLKSGAIGDSYNDIPMLKDADISFTFNDSPEIVKENAHVFVNHVYEAINLLMK